MYMKRTERTADCFISKRTVRGVVPSFFTYLQVHWFKKENQFIC